MLGINVFFLLPNLIQQIKYHHFVTCCTPKVIRWYTGVPPLCLFNLTNLKGEVYWLVLGNLYVKYFLIAGKPACGVFPDLGISYWFEQLFYIESILKVLSLFKDYTSQRLYNVHVVWSWSVEDWGTIFLATAGLIW